jgi:hypothetical protein
MLGFYENFPETIHGIARVAVSLSTRRLQQTLIATFQKLNSETHNIETLAAPSIRKCIVDFEFGIAEGKGFNYIDNEETAKTLQAMQKKPFGIMDFFCALRYHKTQGKESSPLRFDYFMVRLAFNEGLIEMRISHEKGPRHVEPEDVIRLIVNEVNQACKKKTLRIIDLA